MFELEARIVRHPVTAALAQTLAAVNLAAPRPLLTNGRRVAEAAWLLPVACQMVRDVVVMPLPWTDGLLAAPATGRVAALAYEWRSLFVGDLAVAWQGDRSAPASHSIETWSALTGGGLAWLAANSTAATVAACGTAARTARRLDLGHFAALALTA